jgi:Flp pilus assembly pilin Flp
VARTTHKVRSNQRGQAITEYAVLLVVVLMIVLGTVRMVSQKLNSAFSSVVNSSQQQQQPHGD